MGKRAYNLSIHRYRTRDTYSQTTYGDWSGFGDEVIYENSSRQVSTRVVYRYRDRVTVTTYYFQRWMQWSDYGTEPITESETTEIESKTQYRFRSGN